MTSATRGDTLFAADKASAIAAMSVPIRPSRADQTADCDTPGSYSGAFTFIRP